MKRKRAATRVPGPDIIGWAAGLYEGEGSCEGRCSGTNRTTELVRVTQKGDWILIKLRAYFGGSIWTNRNGVSCWYLTGDDARRFVRDIWSYLSPWRRSQWKMAAPKKVHP